MNNAIFWFRRDLRLEDNRAFHEALAAGAGGIPLYIYEPEPGLTLNARQKEYADSALAAIDRQLRQAGSGLRIEDGPAPAVFERLVAEMNIESVYANEIYEPAAIQRDERIAKMLEDKGIGLKLFPDRVYFAKDEILKADGSPYRVFTAYKKKWLEKFAGFAIPEYNTQELFNNLKKIDQPSNSDFQNINFNSIADLNPDIIKNYDNNKDYPAIDGTTRAGADLALGTLSVRRLVRIGAELNQKWLDQLIWRDFFNMIMYQHPESAGRNFNSKYDAIEWLNNPDDLGRWKAGETGYPLIDAAMRELSETGWMNNRLRMLTAGFLTKNLLTDWRYGAEHFSAELIDHDAPLNIGNWQWAAGTGCDAAPYFRIFNPMIQRKKFDPENIYIRRWLSEREIANPRRIVDWAESRRRAIAAYQRALST